MSRVGKSPVALSGAEVKIENGFITVKGSLGTISQPLNKLVNIVVDNGAFLKFEPVDESREANAMSGTMRATRREHGARRDEGFRAQARRSSAWAIVRKRKATS